jgi:cell division protease FtsH
VTRKAPDPGGSDRIRPLRYLWIALLLAVAVLWIWPSGAGVKAPSEVDYSLAYRWLSEDKIESVVLRQQTLEGELRGAEEVDGQAIRSFRTSIPAQDDSLVRLLHERGVNIRVEDETRGAGFQVLVALLPWVLLIGFWFWLSRRAQRMASGGGALGGILRSRSHKFEKAASPAVRFDDVAGLTAAKRDLREVTGFLHEPDRFRGLGARAPRGILLVGPPGTGKTLLARAVAGESGVPFYSISGSEFIEMFVGVGAARVRDLFQEAKRNAPAIIFIDEIDAVGRARGAGFGGGHDEREQTLNQLLAEMDGFDRSDQIVVLAATNRPDVLDPALLRPGRFDRRVFVERPAVDARRAILEVHARGKPLAADVDLDQLARDTPGFSGADLANLVNEAALLALRRDAEQIAAVDVAAAHDKVVLGDPREGKLDPAERRRVAVHESGHAIVARFAEHADPLRRVTILPRGLALGATQQSQPEDRYLATQPQLEARLQVLMGGYAAEREVLGNLSSGAEHDLRGATELASRMVAHLGMSDRLGPIYHEHRTEHPFLGQRIATEGGTSDATVHAIEIEARVLLSRALEAAAAIIRERRVDLDRLVEALLEKETLEGDELTAALSYRQPCRPVAGSLEQDMPAAEQS